MNDQGMIQQMVLGFLRHALTAGGGALMAKGLISQSQSETLVAAALVLVTVAWSAWDKHKAAELNKVKNEIIKGQQQEIHEKTQEIKALS